MTAPHWARIMAVLVVALGLTLVTGCILPPTPVWRSVHYDPAGIQPLPQLPAIALYQFDDMRQVRGKRIGVRNYIWHGRKTCSPACSRSIVLVFGQQPVAMIVTQAFGEGLKTRGFLVVDRTSETFSVVQSELPTSPTLVGEVNAFWIEYGSSSVSAYVRCTVTLRVIHPLGVSGRPTWEQQYDVSYFEDSDSLDRLVETLNRALAQVVREVVNDPDFLAQFR